MKDNTRVIDKILAAAERRKVLSGLILIIISLAGFYNLYQKIKPSEPVLARHLLKETADNLKLSPASEEIPFDPWGNKILLKKENDRFILISKGKDQLVNTPDDIIYETKKDTL